MLVRLLTPLRSHEVVERLCCRLPTTCPGFADDVVEVGGSLWRQLLSVLEGKQAPFAISEQFLVAGRDCRKQGIDRPGHFLVSAHLWRP